MGSGVVAFIGFLIILLIVALLYQYGMRYVFDYRITKDGVRVVLFGIFTLFRIVSNDNIDYVKEISFGEASGLNLMFSARLGNRLWGRILLIRKKRGFIKNILISPDSIDEYIEELNRKK